MKSEQNCSYQSLSIPQFKDLAGGSGVDQCFKQFCHGDTSP
jgi:hypothetical protein